jgi:hypothetical protein
MANLTNPEPLSQEAQRAFAELRASHQLRALTASEDGSGVNRLPGGVFGFTYSPVEDNFPLFNDRDLRSFETHKLADGRVLLLGFLTKEEAKSFEAATSETTIHLFPEPKGEATELVRVPLPRVVRHVESSARRGTGLELLVGAAR